MVSSATRCVLSASALGALCVAAAACSSKDCPGVLQSSAVGITVPAHLLPQVGRVTFHACADGKCNRATYPLGSPGAAPTKRPLRQFGVSTSRLPEDADVTVSVRIAVADRVVFSGTTRAHTVKPDLYDPGCGLDHWGVAVTAHRDGRLT